MNLEQLKERLLTINQQMLDIINAAEGEKRELTDEEVDKLESHKADFKTTERQIDAIESTFDLSDKLREGLGRKTEPNEPGATPNDPGTQNAAPPARPKPTARIEHSGNYKGTWGFKSFGDFAASVRIAHPAMSQGKIDPRLINAPSTYSTEGTGADGGFAVPPDFRAEIWEKVMGEDSLLQFCDRLETSSNTITFPKDETTPWQTSGGVLAYWASEASQLTQSKVALEAETLKLDKLTALVPVTEELLEDAPALDAYLSRKVPQKMNYKIADGIINGTGAGEPTGILNAGCLTSVTKDSGQSADTISVANVVGMWSRCYAPCRSRAIWIYNQDIEPQLLTMTISGASSGVYPVYLPPGGLSDSPYGRLMGRPCLPHQAAKTLGDKGDILLLDLSQYLVVYKTGGIRQAASIHLYFDYDMVAFRFTFRITGQPWWRTYITPASGSSNYLSCFVSLDERA